MRSKGRRELFVLWFPVAVVSLAVLFVTQGCGKGDSTSDIQETGQQIGDVMASIDESGGSNGSLALMEGSSRAFARLAPGEIRDSWLESIFAKKAYAASCFASNTFGNCTNNVITRTFSSCTILGATFDGTVTLTFDDAAVNGTCLLASTGDSITRVPAFTVTGRRGATLTVSKTGSVGQKIAKETSGFTFTNDGIRRVFTANGSTLFDFTTETTSGITVTGATRAGRTLSGGTLRVTNNLTGVTCDFSPSNVTWTSTCNCPTSGSWSASCSDGKAASLSITGCGTADLTVGSDTESFSFDRCYGTS